MGWEIWFKPSDRQASTSTYLRRCLTWHNPIGKRSGGNPIPGDIA